MHVKKLISWNLWPIAFKQLYSLTTINTFSWLDGHTITHRTRVEEVPNSIPGSGKNLCLISCIDDVVALLILSKTQSLTRNFVFLLFWNLYSTLNIVLNLWPILRVPRNWQSIFKCFILYTLHYGISFDIFSLRVLN